MPVSVTDNYMLQRHELAILIILNFTLAAPKASQPTQQEMLSIKVCWSRKTMVLIPMEIGTWTDCLKLSLKQVLFRATLHHFGYGDRVSYGYFRLATAGLHPAMVRRKLATATQSAVWPK